MLVVVAALALSGSALLSGAAGATAARSSGGQLGMGPAHWFGPTGYGNFGNVQPRPTPPTTALAPTVDNLVNKTGNGEIMPTTNTHLIFWLPAGFHYSGGTSLTTDTAYENAMITYFKDIGGSQILNTTTQYCGGNGCPADTSTFKDSVLDTTAYPDTGADVAHAVTQTNINTEVFNQITANSWPLGLSDMYFVFLPNKLVDCNDAKTSCNTNKYCAYHTRGWSGSDDAAHDFIWADIPDDRSDAEIGGCGDSNVTGDESADTTISSLQHEQMEAITDPRGNAWQDSTGGAGENGDKCNREMGVADASSTTPNNFLGAGNTDKFRMQREWSNAAGGGGCAASYTTTGSNVESPAPSGTDVAKSVTEAKIAGNTADTLHYTLTFTNPSNQDDAYAVKVVDTLPTGVKSGGSTTLTFDLGDLAPHQTATQTFTAQPAAALLAGTTLTNSAKFDFNDSTGAAQSSITRTAVTTVVNAAPVLAALPDKSVEYHDPLTFSVSATDADSGDTLTFAASGLPTGLSLTDNGDRTATIQGTDTASPGDYPVTISVDDHHHVSATSGTMTIHVGREETTTKYTGQLVILVGSSGATLTAQLQEDGAGDNDGDGTTAAAPDTGRAITFTLGGQPCMTTTDASGNATCTLTLTQLALIGLGPQTVKAAFAGDTLYQPSQASASAFVFAFPSKGAFVLGNQTATATVTWWGNNWNLLNSLSGGPAPASFKGFAGTVATLPTGGAQPSSCSGTWVTTGGNSPPPTSGVPSYMGVLVASTVGKSGSAISGNFVHIVVVKVNPGYAPSPMNAGTGTIVATYC